MSNRYVCYVIDEIRDFLKYSNLFTYKYCNARIRALLEEVQSLANKMEASLSDKHDYERIRVKVKKAKEELKLLEAKIEVLKGSNENTTDKRIRTVFDD